MILGVSFVEETMKNKQEEYLIFKKLDIPWLLDQDSTLLEKVHMDSEVENLRKDLKQHKSQIHFFNESNDLIVNTNKILREDLEHINAHYQELIAVSKEALKRKRKMENQAENLIKQIQDLNKQNKVLSNKVKSMETKQARDKKKSHALEGIAMLAEVAKQLCVPPNVQLSSISFCYNVYSS